MVKWDPQRLPGSLGALKQGTRKAAQTARLAIQRRTQGAEALWARHGKALFVTAQGAAAVTALAAAQLLGTGHAMADSRTPPTPQVTQAAVIGLGRFWPREPVVTPAATDTPTPATTPVATPAPKPPPPPKPPKPPSGSWGVVDEAQRFYTDYYAFNGHSWSGWCEAFVTRVDAAARVREPYDWQPSAVDALSAARNAGIFHPASTFAEMPPGSVVFWGPADHIAIYSGVWQGGYPVMWTTGSWYGAHDGIIKEPLNKIDQYDGQPTGWAPP